MQCRNTIAKSEYLLVQDWYNSCPPILSPIVVSLHSSVIFKSKTRNENNILCIFTVESAYFKVIGIKKDFELSKHIEKE